MAAPLREAKAQLQDSYHDDVLWTSAGSLAANNLLLEVAETCVNPTLQGSAVHAAARAVATHTCIKR